MRAKKEINMRIGANIQAARESARYTQEELSEILDITPNHLSAIERGVSGATLETIEKICKIFSVSVDSLFFGEQSRDNYINEMTTQLRNIPEKYHSQVKKMLSILLEIIEIQNPIK